MITEFLSTVGAWITGFFGLVTSSIQDALGIIYDSATDKFTIIGMLMLFGLAVGLVYFGINFVIRLVKK